MMVNDLEKKPDNGLLKSKSKTMDESLEEILAYIAEIKKESAEKKMEGDILNEWKCVAMILDRLMFWIGFVITVIAVPAMLLIRDTDHD